MKNFKYSILRDFNLVIRQSDGQAVCGVAASSGVACFLKAVNKDNLVIEIDVIRNQKTWHHLGEPALAEGNNTYRPSYGLAYFFSDLWSGHARRIDLVFKLSL